MKKFTLTLPHRLVFILLFNFTPCIYSVPQNYILPRNSESLHTFIEQAKKVWGREEALGNHGFRYNQVYNSILQYQIINAFINNEQLRQAESLQKDLKSLYTGYQAGFFIQFIVLFIELILLIFMIYLKIVKRHTAKRIQREIQLAE